MSDKVREALSGSNLGAIVGQKTFGAEGEAALRTGLFAVQEGEGSGAVGAGRHGSDQRGAIDNLPQATYDSLIRDSVSYNAIVNFAMLLLLLDHKAYSSMTQH